MATANRVQTMPAPLLDRMEVIELPGYTSEEKLRIAMRHLIPRVLDQHGITDQHVQISEVRCCAIFEQLLSSLFIASLSLRRYFPQV